MSAARVDGFFKCVLLFGFTLLLVACGGGGGGSSTLPPLSSSGNDTGSNSSSGGGAQPTPTPAPTSAPPAVQSAMRLFNGSFVFAQNDSSLYALLAQTLTQNTRLSVDITRSDPSLAHLIGDGKTMEMAASLANVSHILSDGESAAYYDIEHWGSTPLSEQRNPVTSIAQAARIVHNAHERFGISPDGQFMGREGSCRFDVSKGIAPQIDWSEVDEVNIQAQALADDSSCGAGNVSKYAAFVSQIASLARAGNPNVYIVAQVSLVNSSPTTALKAAGAVRGVADAIYVAYPTPCGNCTMANLAEVLGEL